MEFDYAKFYGYLMQFFFPLAAILTGLFVWATYPAIVRKIFINSEHIHMKQKYQNVLQRLKTFLIVDDEERICEDIKSELEYLGNNRVITSERIQEAKSVIDSKNLNYAIIDLKLDNTTAYGGMKIYSYIKKNKPDIKTIIISGFPFEGIKYGLMKELLREDLPENEIDVIERYYVYKGGTEDYIEVILSKLGFNLS
ncbi:response regulator [Thiotrichales bacterium HSG1]|nr:response regulator [Thiotrichales bacterium HSG1]